MAIFRLFVHSTGKGGLERAQLLEVGPDSDRFLVCIDVSQTEYKLLIHLTACEARSITALYGLRISMVANLDGLALSGCFGFELYRLPQIWL